MSIKLMSLVWECDLPPNQTFVLLAMADHAHDDGSRCFPSVAKLAWKCGYSRRQIQNIIQALRKKAILLVVNHDTGGRGSDGRGQSTEYLIRLTDVPKKQPYQSNARSSTQKGAIIAPLTLQSTTQKGAPQCTHRDEIHDKEGCTLRQRRVHSTSPQPLVNITEPSSEPSVNPGENEKFWDTVLDLLQLQVTRPSFETWLKGTKCVSITVDVATIGVANSFVKEMLHERLYSLICRAIEQVPPYPKEVLFEVATAEEGTESP